MRPLLIILTLILVAGESQAESPIVAVFGVQAPLPANTRRALTDFIGVQLVASGNYRILPRSQIKIGRELSANKSLATRIPGSDEPRPTPGKMFALTPGIDYVYQASNGGFPLTVSVGAELPLAGELGDHPPYLFLVTARFGFSASPMIRAMRRGQVDP